MSQPEQVSDVVSAGLAALLEITSMSQLFGWYQKNLCGRGLVDPRGCRVDFLDTDFVHLIKMMDKYGKEPRNRRMTIERIGQDG